MLIQENKKIDSTWEFDGPKSLTNEPIQIIPFDHGGHANILCIRRDPTQNTKTFSVEIYDPYGPTYRWAPEGIAVDNMKKELDRVFKEWGAVRDVTYPVGIHPQQVQLATSRALYVHFGAKAEETWNNQLCMFWSSLVVFIWYKTCKKLSLHTIGHVLASALQAASYLDIDTVILSFADYLSRIGLHICKNTPGRDKLANPVSVTEAISTIGKERGVPTIVRVIQRIKKGSCSTKELALLELKTCVQQIIKECSPISGDLS